MREVFQTPGQVVLEIRLPDGDVDISTAQRQDTVVELTGLTEEELLEVARIDLHERGDVSEVIVEVEDKRGWGARFWRNRSIRLAVDAPDGVEARVRVGSADVRGRGRFGVVAVESGSGDISFGDVDGDAVVKSGSGDIDLAEVGGDAVLSSASGDIDVERVGGTAQVRSASGDVHVGDAQTDVTVQTASGDVKLDAVVDGQVIVQSASGDILVGIRRGSRLAVDARSMSGDTTSELELDDVPTGAGDDGPLVELRATAMSGDIHVARA